MDFPDHPIFTAGYDAGYQEHPPLYPPTGTLINDLRLWIRGYDQGRSAWGVDHNQGRLDLEPKA